MSRINLLQEKSLLLDKIQTLQQRFIELSGGILQTESDILDDLLRILVKEQSHLLTSSRLQNHQPTMTSSGPGQVNLVSALFDQDEKVWISQPQQPDSHTKEKIMLSCGDFITFSSGNTNWLRLVIFLNLLLSHKEIYLWQGRAFVSISKPIKTQKELWDKIPDSVSASTEQVRKKLHEEGAYHYIILDSKFFMQLLSPELPDHVGILHGSIYHREPLKFYPEWSTYSGRQQLLSWLKSTTYDRVSLSPPNTADQLDQFKKIFKENESMISTNLIQIEASDSFDKLTLKCREDTQVLEGFTSTQLSSFIFTFFREFKKTPALATKLEKLDSIIKAVNIELPRDKKFFNTSTLKIPNHLISLKIEPHNISSEDYKSFRFGGEIQCTGGENLEYLSIFDTHDFLFKATGESKFISIPRIHTPEFLPHLKFLSLCFYADDDDFHEKELFSLSKMPSLQFLRLTFVGEHGGNCVNILLSHLPKVRQIQCFFPTEPEVKIKLKIEDAPNLELLYLNGSDHKNQRVILTYSGCPKLKFIKSHSQWLSRSLKESGQIDLIIQQPQLLTLDDEKPNNVESKAESKRLELKDSKRQNPNRVSYFSKEPTIKITSPKGLPLKTEIVKASDPWKCLVLAEDPVDIRELIWAVYGNLNYDEIKKQIGFRELGPKKQSLIEAISKNSKTVKETWLADLSGGFSVGILTGPISANSWQLLPMQGPLLVDVETQRPSDFEIASHPPQVLKVLWDSGQRCCYVKAHSEVTGEIEVVYRYRADGRYRQYRQDSPQLTAASSPLIHPGLKDIIFKYIEASIPKLKFLIDSNRSLTERFNLLIDYCRQFEQEPLKTSSLEEGSVAQLLTILKEQRGVCEQRSLAFYVLSLCLGITVDCIHGDRHAYIRLMTPQGQLYLLDLDGGILPTEIAAEDRDPIQLIGSSLLQSPESKTNTSHTLPEIKGDPRENFDYQLMTQLVSPLTLKNIEQLFLMAKVLKNKSPLIILPESISPLAAKNHLVHYLRSRTDKNFVYIDCPQDFIRYLQPMIWDEKIRRRQQKTGPLAEIIQSGGVIIVNWKSFITDTTEQLSAYQSLLDQEAQLLGQPVSKENLIIIGLGHEALIKQDVFISRCQQYHPPQDWLFPLKTQTLSDEKPDLEWKIQNSANWQEELLANVSLSKKTIAMTDVWLVELAKSRKDSLEKKPITIKIVNPPRHDRQFEVLCDQVNQEGRFNFNGEWRDAKGIILIPDTGPLFLPNVAHLITLKTEQKSVLKKKHYLRASNLYECDRRLVIDSDSGAYHREGWLATYNADQDEFYLVQNLAENQQYLLYCFIEKYQRPITIRLAPGVTLNNKTGELLSEHKLTENCCSCRISNDPDYDCQQLLKTNDKYLVLHVSPETQYQDLLALLKFDQKLAESLCFIYKPGPLLTALKQGRNVIVNGELSEFLYLELLSALASEDPHLECNGERISLKPGQLVLIQPDSPVVRKRLAGKMVYSDIPHKPEKNLSVTNPFCVFIDMVRLTPHEGRGCPVLPITQQWVKNCTIAYQKANPDLHPHNPLKGLTAAHYSPESVSYHYLNVLGKYFFAPSDNSPVRVYKIYQLFSKYNICHVQGLKQHVWELLNCFNGAHLRLIFGEALVNAIKIDQDSSWPTLLEDILLPFYNYLQETLRLNSDHKLRAHTPQFPKRERQLSALLNSPHPVISIEGMPGVGKTFFVDQLKQSKNFRVYEGWSGLSGWLRDRSDNQVRKIWVLDDDMNSAGAYAFAIKGLWSDSKIVVYDNQEHYLTEAHKMLVITNPAYFTNRSSHTELLESETLIFKMPSRQELVNLLTQRGIPQKISDLLVMVFLKVLKINPHSHYSLRNLEDYGERFKFMGKQTQKESFEKIFFMTAESAFAYGISDHTARELFIRWLIQLAGQDYRAQTGSLINLSLNHSSFKVPGEYLPVLRTIIFMLAMRHQAIQKDHHGGYKQGLLVEGPPGVGKSTWFEACCLQAFLYCSSANETKGIQKKRKHEQISEIQNKYSKVSAGTTALLPTVKQMGKEGNVVIIEEFTHLNREEERCVNQFLTGKGGGQTGFLLFASKNPATALSNTSFSQATLSRLDKMEVKEPSPLALLHIAENKLGKEEGGRMTAAYLRVKKENPKTNTRHFFQMLALKQNSGPEKRFLLNHVLFNSLNHYKAKLQCKIPLQLLEVQAIEALIQSFQGHVNFSKQWIDAIQNPQRKIAILLKQFTDEGGELPETFLKQATPSSESIWADLGDLPDARLGF